VTSTISTILTFLFFHAARTISITITTITVTITVAISTPQLLKKSKDIMSCFHSRGELSDDFWF
jgi:hypothetical protein